MSNEKPPQEVPELTGAEYDQVSVTQPYPEQTKTLQSHSRESYEEPQIEHQARNSSNSVGDAESQRTKLEHVRSHVSTHDAPGASNEHHYEQGDEIYDKFTPQRKIIIVCVLSFCSFLAPIS